MYQFKAPYLYLTSDDVTHFLFEVSRTIYWIEIYVRRYEKIGRKKGTIDLDQSIHSWPVTSLVNNLYVYSGSSTYTMFFFIFHLSPYLTCDQTILISEVLSYLIFDIEYSN